MKTKSLLLAILIFILAVFPLASCSSNSKIQKRSSVYVEDSEWFDNEVYTLDSNTHNSGFSYRGNSPIIYADDTQVVIWEEYQYFDNGTEEEIVQYGRYEFGDNGEVTCTGAIDLVEAGLTYHSDDWTEVSDIGSEFYFNGRIYCNVRRMDENGYSSYWQVVDLDNNSLGEIISNETTELLLEIENGGVYSNWIEDGLLNMIIANFSNQDSVPTEYSHIRINESFEIVDEHSFYPPEGKTNYIRIHTVDENYFLGETVDYASDTFDVYLIDRNTYATTHVEENLEDYFLYRWYDYGGNMLSSDRHNVVVFDSTDCSARPIFSFDNCNVDRSRSSYMSIAYADEDVILLWVCGPNGNFQFWKFTRAESNPNVGKEIIRLADLGERTEHDVARAIYEYNEGDNEGYIVFDDRYDLTDRLDMDIDDYNYENTDEYTDAVRNARSELSNQIRIDILAGEGPDILIGAYDYSEFNNEQILINLRDELTVDQSLYINPIFAGNEPIYQLPLILMPTGVMWEFRYVDELVPGQGFTYADYDQYVNEIYVGIDPISESFDRVNYFITLFNYSYSHFVSDGVININNDEFKAMAEFAYSRIDMERNDMPSNVYYTDYLDYYSANSGVLTAMPSADGDSGIMLTCNLSVGVATTCPNEDAALGFVETLMDRYSNQIVRDDIREDVNEYIEWENAYIDRNIGSPLFEYLTEDSYIREELADEYVNLLDNANGIIVSDSDISIVLFEEMQPYFAGDKTIEEVIPIIEDRIQTVLSERG